MQGLLQAASLQAGAGRRQRTLTQEELRSLVLEGSQYFRGKHKTMLANLFDLEAITVDDVMTPRNQIDALDLDDKPALLRQQLATSYHSRLPVYEGTLDNIVGVLPLKQVVRLQQSARSTPSTCATILRPPYFVPAGTPLLTQLQQFQTDRQRLGLVVDEYGELLGLVTIEDILEEIIGEFTTPGAGRPATSSGASPTAASSSTAWRSLRTLNRRLGTAISAGRAENAERADPRASGRHSGRRRPLSRSAGKAIEILQTQDRAVKVVTLAAPVGRGSRRLYKAGSSGHHRSR